jgi:hypothetical protein
MHEHHPFPLLLVIPYSVQLQCSLCATVRCGAVPCTALHGLSLQFYSPHISGLPLHNTLFVLCSVILFGVVLFCVVLFVFGHGTQLVTTTIAAYLGASSPCRRGTSACMNSPSLDTTLLLLLLVAVVLVLLAGAVLLLLAPAPEWLLPNHTSRGGATPPTCTVNATTSAHGPCAAAPTCHDNFSDSAGGADDDGDAVVDSAFEASDPGRDSFGASDATPAATPADADGGGGAAGSGVVDAFKSTLTATSRALPPMSRTNQGELPSPSPTPSSPAPPVPP